MVTLVVVLNDAQPLEAGMVYETTYEPAVLVDGVIAPVPPLMLKPDVEEKVPPVLPVTVTLCGVDTDLQNGAPV